MNNNKIVVLGDSTVGKSSILHYFKNKLFMKDIETTIGCDFFARNVTFENKNVKLLIWDTAGQEIFRSFTPNFLRGSSVIIIVYKGENCMQYTTEMKVYDCLAAVMWTAMFVLLMAY